MPEGKLPIEQDAEHDDMVRGGSVVIWQDSLHAYEISYYLFKQGLDVTLSGWFKIEASEI